MNTNWKLINTAPINKRILVLWKKSKHIEDATIYYTDDGFLSHCLFDGERLNDEPDYWMEIPE